MAEQDSGKWFLRTMIRKGRTAAEKSQSKIGEEVGRSKDTISDWETGKTDIPVIAIDSLATACKLSAEICNYMKAVARARKKGLPIEADMRYNALFLALAEEYSGFIFKFDALIVPGPLQIRVYHDGVVRVIDPKATDEDLEDGWGFKEERAESLEARTDLPTVHFLIGEAALLMLRQISEEIYQAQMAHLRRWAQKQGIVIRILRAPAPARMGTFEIFKPGRNKLASPPFVYTEIADSSWCISDPDRIKRYDDIRKMLWNLAIRIEDYHDDNRRDGLA